MASLDGIWIFLSLTNVDLNLLFYTGNSSGIMFAQKL